MRRCANRFAPRFANRLANRLAVLSVIIFGFVVFSFVGQSVAQERKKLTVANTSSPRDTLRSFIDACNEINEQIHGDRFFDRYDPAHNGLRNKVTDCIDLSEIPDYARDFRATEIAVYLKEILDRVELPQWDEIPDTKWIEQAGGFEKLSVWRIPETRITIARVESGPQKHEYLFSPGTADRAKLYFEQVKLDPYRTSGPAVSHGLLRWYFTVPGNRTMASIVGLLPEGIQRGRTYGLANWKWPGLLLAIVVTLGLILIAFRIQWSISRRAQNKGPYWYCVTLVFPVFAMLVPLLFQAFIENFLTIRGFPLYLLSFLANLAVVLFAMVVVFSASSRVAEAIIASPRIDGAGLNAQLIRIMSKIVSMIGAMILFVIGGQYLGIAIGTLMASAGIFGAAIALAAQDVIKGVFGTLTLLSDKPFRVGERIMFEKYDGVIEDIGLRSSRLRLLTGSLVTLPNDRLAGNDVENVTNRKHLRRQMLIRLPLDSRLQEVEKAVAIINEELDDHQGMDPKFPPRVFFDEFDSTSFKIRVFYWFSPPDYWEFKEFGQSLNFSIFRRFEEEGIRFSLPSRHSLWKNDSEQGPIAIQMVEGSESQDD